MTLHGAQRKQQRAPAQRCHQRDLPGLTEECAMNHAPRTRRHHQQGAAALLVVVVLFFILAMVTAYAGRGLIFEQRTSVNNQRAAQAFEAAESGLDLAIGLLGGGRVDQWCVSTNDVARDTSVSATLTQDATGQLHVFWCDGQA